ncbi:double-strand break repair protein MRE11, putative [Plasmodium berghei]|uniref:Double-strand break repair protein MRE11, putative n=2 Tax=Plasmodium berghei TaxID=5821 RepID=A0A509AE92_PLABA|nr:double-strand break repair protein MRE11, putative [Plasmodium berghei ANKA]CXH86901.1 double-strand break repair protein MRE11, putative [Plasmodium berghei]SCL90043.1 double-strand break repair protein MRE11, putative [Plasmodium berghei]SCM15206.1 double-strand break repair protein MRE11, putative [Plasmodium berghei]SCM17001.1 double-strand break repair protein MRE11, putative [Plasmodium berghei]SCN21844.1 double-strand break repair protein MRE11, putative [Plasmodium berghei]|eukprot:XP_034419782.1 double-strand break repair protein MRE11, putative [Plasmodium berghei ANKA]
MKDADKDGMDNYLSDLDKNEINQKEMENEICKNKNVSNIRGNRITNILKGNTINVYKTRYVENSFNENEQTTRISIKDLYQNFNKTRNLLIENEETSKTYKHNINANIPTNEIFLKDMNFNYASNKTQNNINPDHFCEKNNHKYNYPILNSENKLYQSDNKIKKGNKNNDYIQNKSNNIKLGKTNQKTTIMDYFQSNNRYKSTSECKVKLENKSAQNKNQSSMQFQQCKEVKKNDIDMYDNEINIYNMNGGIENGNSYVHNELMFYAKNDENFENGESIQKKQLNKDCSFYKNTNKKKYNIIDERNENIEYNSNSLKNMNIENIKQILRSNDPNTLKILLCTDNHLGYKENNPIQKKDTFNTFEEILFIAKKLNVDMILNSGDLFHKNKVSEYTLFKTMSIIRKYCHVNNKKDDEKNQNKLKDENNCFNINQFSLYQQKSDISVSSDSQMHTSEYTTFLNEVTNYRYDFYDGNENIPNTFFETGEKDKPKRCRKNEINEMKEIEGFQSSLDGNYDEIRKNVQYKMDNEIINKSDKEEYNTEMKILPVNEKFEKSIPFYTIHGNHDYPYSYDYICPLDILNISNLINYIGKNNMEKLVIKPILLNKKGTHISIYAIGWIKDERLYNYFENKNIKFIIPEDYKNRINILVLHQNRYMRNTNSNNSKNFIKESFIPSFIDLVIWGHEHNSKPQLEESLFHTFYNLQLGSSVRTSLCVNEYGDKYIGLLEIKNERFRFLKINLETVRPFELKEIKLSNYDLNFNDEYVLKQFLHDQTNSILDKIRKQLLNQIKNYYLFKKIFFPSLFEKEKNDRINCGITDLEEGNIISSITDKCVNDFFSKLQNDDFYTSSFIHLAFFSEKYDTFNLLKIKKNVYNKPLIKIKIEYNEINIINTQLFGSEFIDKITNASEFLSFYKKKTKLKDLQSDKTDSNGKKIDAEDKENMNMEYINEYNKVFDILFDYCDIKNDLLILNQKIIMDTIQNVIINTNPSFGSDGNVNSNYNSLEIMAEKMSEEKIKKIMNELKDIPVDHITTDYIETVGKSINSTISEMNK